MRLGVDGQSTAIEFRASATQFISLKKVEIEPGRLFGFEKWPIPNYIPFYLLSCLILVSNIIVV